MIDKRRIWITGNYRPDTDCLRVKNYGNDISNKFDQLMSILTNIFGTYGDNKTTQEIGMRGGWWYSLFTGTDYGTTLIDILDDPDREHQKLKIQAELERISQKVVGYGIVTELTFNNLFFNCNKLLVDMEGRIANNYCKVTFNISKTGTQLYER